MHAFRIAKEKYIHDLRGEGSKINGGRWNKKGVNVLYTSQHESLAALEVLVHLPAAALPDDLRLTTFTIPDNVSSKQIELNLLAQDWRNYPAPYDLTDIGTNWIQSGSSLILKAPSVIIPSEYNILINPVHPEFSRIEIIDIRAFGFDNRLKR